MKLFSNVRLISAPYLALKRSYSGFSLIKFCNGQTDGRMNSPKLCDPDHLKIVPKAVPWVRIVVSGSITGCWKCHVQWNEGQEQNFLFYFTFYLQRNFRELNDLMNCVTLYFRSKLLRIHIICVDFSLSESAGNERWNDPKRLQI